MLEMVKGIIFSRFIKEWWVRETSYGKNGGLVQEYSLVVIVNDHWGTEHEIEISQDEYYYLLKEMEK